MEPFDGGSDLIIFVKVNMSNWPSGVAKALNGVTLCLCTFDCWK